MAWKTPMIVKENGQVDYSAKRSAGTQWAINHVARTFKTRQTIPCQRCKGTGSDCGSFPIPSCPVCNGHGTIETLVMLTPPPLAWKDRHAK